MRKESSVFLILPDEKVIFRTHPHWLILEGALVFTGGVIFLGWLCTNYYLTSLRLIDERGIIGKRIMSIPLKRIQDIKCQFGIWGRIFGFGDLEIESAGTYGKITFHFIPSPQKFKEKIIQAIKMIQGELRKI